ncbi:MAG: NADPH-dependent F420 reductase [Aeromicrobium sp.]
MTEQIIGVLGGTGSQGRGIALRLARAGVKVVLGSRDATRAEEAAAALGSGVTGADNAGCAAAADIVIVAVPYDGHRDTLAGLREELTGKIVVDCVNALGFGKEGPFALDVPDGSACQEAAATLPDSTVIGAFQNLSAEVLLNEEITSVDADVLVLGEDRPAVERIIALADVIPGVRGIYGGRLRNAGQVESLTANLIAINRRYKTHASIRITGV